MRFQCLGVTWAIEFGNHEPDVAVGERFAATLQITLAHLALADPALLPTSVKVLVTAGTPGTDLAIEQVDSTPTETCFRCTLAATEHRSREVHNTVAQQTLAAVATVIVTVSTLPDDQWKLLLDQAFEQDLPSITTFAMPYDAALHGTIRNHHLDLALDEQRPLVGHDTTCPDTAPGLEYPGPWIHPVAQPRRGAVQVRGPPQAHAPNSGGAQAGTGVRGHGRCTCCNQTRNVLVSAARASYPTLEQAIWSTMHNQTGAS